MTKQHPIRNACAKAVSLALVAVLLLAPVQSIAYAADAGSTQPQKQQVSAFQFKYPAEHTFTEINQFYAEHPYDTSLPDKYDIQPDISNEEINTRIGTDTTALLDAKGKADRDTLAGSLSQETLDNALNATNFMRYSAGLQLLYIHTNDRIGGYQWRAQAGAALLAELNTITHNVDGNEALAAGVVNGVFGWAKAGPGGSNIVAGSGVANKMINSFMPDIGNDRTGLSHRSYILNPGLSGTGFGAANLSGTTNPKTGKARGSAVAMFVTYYGGDPDNLSAVLWPSCRQPIETFQARGTWQMSYPEGNPYQGNPWSYFINAGSVKVDTSTLKVTLECDGKPTDVLDLNNLTAAEKSENRLFTIGSSPLKRLIAFRPHVAYGAGDKVKVTIEGIVDAQNLPIPVSYDVHFFQTGTEPHPNLEQTAVSRTAADTAEFRFTADYSGTMHYLVLDADQPEPSADAVLGGTKLTLGTDEALLALTDLTGNSAKKLYYITASSTAVDTEHTTANKSGEMSDVKSIDIPAYTVQIVNAEVPAAITLAGAQYEKGAAATPLNGKTAVTDHGTITYQWYSSDAVDNFNGIQLDGATDETFMPSTDTVGIYYYYVVATNTKADATGSKTASVRSNTVQITVQEPAGRFEVRYAWNGEAPADVMLPVDSKTYDTETAARASMDTTYTSSSTSNAQKDGKEGTWTFSGWMATVEDTVVKFTGTWRFTEKETLPDPKPPVTPSRPSTPAKPSQNPDVRPTLPFEDVAGGAWYKDAVQYVYEHGIMSGTGKNIFGPDRNTTRGMFVTMLYRIEKEPPVNGVALFVDARSGYFSKAVHWAQQEGVVTGTSTTEFSPNVPMTREQLAVVLYRYAQYLGRDTSKAAELNEFADRGDVSGYARDAMAWAVAEGLLTGVGGSRLAPTAPATRAQVAEILYRFLRAV